MTDPHSNVIAHHAANAAAIALPVGSVLFHLSAILSVVLTVAGLAWYGVLFYDRFFGPKSP